jgi:hypothetical protein
MSRSPDPPGAARGVATVQPALGMPVVPLTFRAIRLILDRNEALVGSGSALPSSVVAALETALRGRWIGVDSYHVTLTAEDATTLVGWCREAAPASSPRDGAVLQVAATVIEAAL